MTLEQAFQTAQDKGVELFHPNFEGGRFFSPQEFRQQRIPVPLINSDLWDIRKVRRQLDGDTLEAETRNILSRYVSSENLDTALAELKAALFTPR